MQNYEGTRTSAIAAVIAGALALVVFTGCRSQPPPDNSSRAVAPNSVNGPARVQVEAGAPEANIDATKIVSAYNARNVGSPGWRRVVLDLFTGDSVTRSFTVVNLWHSQADMVSTLFLLEQPPALTGTNYLLREWPGKPVEMRVSLFLPAGEQHVLEVEPSNFDEGLLGSDFSYNDIRMQLPLIGYHYTFAGKGVLVNEPVWVVEAVPTEQQSRETVLWNKATLYLARNFAFLLGADYYKDAAIVKQMRVDSVKQIQGVWTATHITMYSADTRRSELRLIDAEFNSSRFDVKLLSPERLPFLSNEVRNGWTTGFTNPPH